MPDDRVVSEEILTFSKSIFIKNKDDFEEAIKALADVKVRLTSTEDKKTKRYLQAAESFLLKKTTVFEKATMIKDVTNSNLEVKRSENTQKLGRKKTEKYGKKENVEPVPEPVKNKGGRPKRG